MIKRVTVTNPKKESLVMELANPESSGIIVENVEGLGPPNTQINMIDLATSDGSVFSSARAEPRNLVLTLAPIAKPLVEDSRHRIYYYFPFKKQVTVEVETDYRKAQVTGYVETVEPNIFSDHETVQVSIVCPDPYFYEEEFNETIFSGVRPMFEFPFSNESLTENLLNMGEIVEDKRVTLNYEGDSDAGILITIHALGKFQNLIIYNVDTYERIEVDTKKVETMTGRPIDIGDDIIISTYEGNRYVKLLRDGKYTNIIGAIDKKADWFVLTAGPNTFTFTVSQGDINVEITFTYRNAYGGI